MTRKRPLIFVALLLALTMTLTSAGVQAKNENGYRLLIYYGIPIEINEANDVRKAAEQFAEYDYIVLGAGLEEKSHGDHESTAEIIAELRALRPDAAVYGYIDLGVTTDNHSMSVIRNKTDKWKAIGADGIFFDDAGYDYGVSRDRLNQAVDYVHKQSMKAFLNAWKPDDIMSSAVHEKWNPKGEKTKIAGGDLYLLESFLEPTDITQADSPSAFGTGFRKKIDAALKYRKLLGVKLMSVSTIDYASVSSTAVRKFFRMNEAAAGVFSLDGYGIAPTEYSTGDETHNEVRPMPYILNYMDFYSAETTYTAKYNDEDFAARGFRLHSLDGDHYYNFPASTAYE
ncbi:MULTISPECIES: hypothetical protein [Cohnella]|uniref:hypothetical protein n=1 Tax=Cohnella TaxID=329857 RepID=UPI0009BBDCF6|nr:MULTISPECIES: hypothetical protein [Cohnella]MBN2981720.1 hypothetical protein [Cohnella algarum]